MSERFIRKKDIAALLGMKPKDAALYLAKHGLYPINLGKGRGKGLRWLESEVFRVMRKASMEAQPKPKNPPPPKVPGLDKPLVEYSANELFEKLSQSKTKGKNKALTDCQIVQ